MGNYKKNVRPMNKAKNLFIKWLKENNAEFIDYNKPEVSEVWDYYCAVSGFIDDVYYKVFFTVWNGISVIDYEDDNNKYNNLSVYDFLQLIEQK